MFNRPRLREGHDWLKAQPIPPQALAEREAFLRENPNASPPPLEPPFATVTGRLLVCFGQPYSAALRGDCGAT